MGYVSVGFGVIAALAAAAVARLQGATLFGYTVGTVNGFQTATLAAKALSVVSVVAVGIGIYRLTVALVERSVDDDRRVYDLRNVLRLAVTLAVVAAVAGVVTEQWVGLLFSFGVVGFAATFALQQPLFSLIGWLYILVKRPYQVGDRVEIEDSQGDVAEVDFFVTTLWEIGGDLVSTHQPSGRTITVPNSVVLSTHVRNYTTDEFPYVWNETTIQVAYETDLAFARETLARVADEEVGDEMASRVARFRDRSADSPVDVTVADRPSVNVSQRESWVELRVRYLVDPKDQQATRNRIYERALAAFNDHPNRIGFPVGRNR